MVPEQGLRVMGAPCEGETAVSQCGSTACVWPQKER